MAGLGIGGLVGGRLADRIIQRAAVYGTVQILVAAWAIVIPFMLDWLRSLVPLLPVLSPESLFVSTLARFGLSFCILVVPCLLMGATLPLLVRTVTESERFIGSRIGTLYCLNTIGAALGCFAAGFWMVGTIGLARTNLVAVGINLAIAVIALALSRPLARAITLGETETPQMTPSVLTLGQERQVSGIILLFLAFINGLAALTCEVLWIRYLAFLDHTAYVFPTILCIYLLGIGLGGLIYSALAARIKRPIMVLGVVEIMLAVTVIATFVISAFFFVEWLPLKLRAMTLITVLFPTILMGISFPLLCAVYGRRVQSLGQRIGLLFAINTAGTVAGSLLPVFVLVPILGIQKSITLISAVYSVMGLVLLASGGRSYWWLFWRMAAGYVLALLFLLNIVPSNLLQHVFLSTNFTLYKHNEIQFYREGRTGTATVTRNVVSDCRTVFINGVGEVPLLYSAKICFKMLGDLAPMLHPNPEEVLMICFGGGIAAGATTQMPEVKHLSIVDLESSVVKAATLLHKENNGLLSNPKTHIVIDDGRNYIMTSNRKWPVIISDSTHPKSSDSWVLYTKEFFQLVREHLTNDGIFVEWLPTHNLTIEEFKIIVRTFQSVFPHASLWVALGLDEEGNNNAYVLMVATPEPLSIDVIKLRDRLSVEAVHRDLEPFGLDTTEGFLDTFLCAEDKLRAWSASGPINTDDLPFTQYQTSYSRSAAFKTLNLIEPMENIWPYLKNTGSPSESENLREKLVLRAKAARLTMQRRVIQASNLLPDDQRYIYMRSLSDRTIPHYVKSLVEMYWNDPEFLDFLSSEYPYGKTVASIYERTLKLNPKSVAALTALGTIRTETGAFQEAEKYLRQAVHLNPDCGPARFSLGMVLDKTGRYDEAIKQWKEAAIIAKDSSSANQLGICLAKGNRFEEAISWFKLSMDIDPSSTIVRRNLARALIKTGRADEAKIHLYYVQKIDPEDKDMLKMLEEIKTTP